ncbi:hypothetical protein [Variovorax sp. PAMC26660]|uniref:hypothetical protein n=1 Tax=Variovorax sp. PAMC26660 TaxID=2762322 RepID=UPI00164E8E0A|nr:hypothetical protein [Variovorax sp. PAMC26660]QNK68573.1 hypothetical protein H7F35_02180 [Variovorax sp. PAMC26660]
MALSACGDGEGLPAATAPRPDEVVVHGAPVAHAQDATGKHGLDNDPRAKPLLLQLRCRLSRCSLIMRLKRSGLLRALLK